MKTVLEDENLRDQLSGIVVNSINESRIADELRQLNIQDENFQKAVQQIDTVRAFVGSPRNILGNDFTKHGEIAEQVEVGVRRARQALDGKELTASFEGVGRTAPEDYIIDGIKVQSKFINGTNKNLDAILKHMDKYSDFGRDGSYYHIPKDEYELIERILDGEKSIDGIRLNTIMTIKGKLALIENKSGKSFQEVVKPGISEYAEVQQGRVSQTLDSHEKQLSENNTQKKTKITEDHQANLGEALKATGIAAAVGATVSLTTSFYVKAKEGKKFYKGDFSEEDWVEIGVDTAKGGVVGGISGATIYGLTNYASLSAPFAGAIVSATRGTSSLVADLNKGKIDKEEFIELGMVVCAESAIVGFATVAGQATIPVPVLGAVIGSIAGSILANSLGAGNKATAKMVREEIDAYLQILDKKYKAVVDEISNDFSNLGELTEAAFDTTNNLKALKMSVDLAIAYGVEESRILKSTADVDSFMLG